MGRYGEEERRQGEAKIMSPLGWPGNVRLVKRKISAGLEVGNVFINGAVKSNPRLPFGGIKRSGWRRNCRLPI